MMIYSRLSLLMILFISLSYWLPAQEKTEKYIYPYTHHMSEEEKSLFHLVGKGYKGTDPPPGDVRQIAEFDQVEGVLIAYPNTFGISYQLIAAMSQETVVTTIVANTTQLNNVSTLYQNNGVNMTNVSFLVAPMNSYWTRDYGPWFVRYGNDQIGVVDFIYNRPNRPLDNAIPQKVAQFMGLSWFGMDLIHAGGNYMTDGYGISASSDLVWDENPSLTQSQISQMVQDYLGVDTYHVVPDPNNTYIDHIDCWGKYLGVDKIMIREVPTSHPQYNAIEATAAYFAAQPSAWGNNYRVYRVWTPNNQPYTNSLILNNRVFVPIMGSVWDTPALESYAEAMPGYEIIGVTGSWQSTDALHCRAIGIADRHMLFIEHYPLLGDQPVQNQYEISASITPYSGAALLNNDVKVFYSINDEPYQEQVMTHTGGKNYTYTFITEIPGSKVEYYLTAVDIAGNMANHPYIGAPDPHIFYVGEPMFAEITLDVTQINAWVNQGGITSESLQISNTGGFPLYYAIEYTSASTEDLTFSIPNSPAANAWTGNTLTENGWHELMIENTEGEIGGWKIDFEWQTDNWPEEGTFYVLSPSATLAVIATGITTGSYTISLNDFDGESVNGLWRFWLTDSDGDGGHSASNVEMTITKSYAAGSWLSVDPVEGTVQPNGSASVQVICDGTDLPVGDFEGTIWISSNDPENPVVEIPVFFTVDLASGSDPSVRNDLMVKNYPNPFKNLTTFELVTSEPAFVSLEIYNVNGQIVRSLISGTLPSGLHQITWDGNDERGNRLENGIYFYRMRSGAKEISDKLILNR
ncbi:MAG: agmatine deiminase family protein [Bacteroidales bacterium]